MKALDIKKRVLNNKTQGFAIKIIYEMKDDFKESFPSAKWNSDEKVWEVGPRSGSRLEAWRDANAENYLTIIQQNEEEIARTLYEEFGKDREEIGEYIQEKRNQLNKEIFESQLAVGILSRGVRRGRRELLKKAREAENKLTMKEWEEQNPNLIAENKALYNALEKSYKLETLKMEIERVKELYGANNNSTDAKKIKEVMGRSLAGLSVDTLKDREVAKLFGGYALVGNKKDKELGEKVRAQKIKGFKRAQSAEYFCDKENQTFQSAKFWIHNINRRPEEFEGFIDTLAKLDKKVEKARKSVKTERRKMGKTRYCPIKKEHERYFVDVEIILDSKEYDAAVKEREEFLEEWGV